MLLFSHSSFFAKTAFSELVLNHFVEVDSFIIVGKVESDLTVIRFKCMKIRAGSFVLELMVDLLIENCGSSVHVHHPDVVRPSGVIFDQAGDTATPLVPSLVSWSLRTIDLNNCCGQRRGPRTK